MTWALVRLYECGVWAPNILPGLCKKTSPTILSSNHHWFIKSSHSHINIAKNLDDCTSVMFFTIVSFQWVAEKQNRISPIYESRPIMSVTDWEQERDTLYIFNFHVWVVFILTLWLSFQYRLYRKTLGARIYPHGYDESHLEEEEEQTSFVKNMCDLESRYFGSAANQRIRCNKYFSRKYVTLPLANG